MFEKTVTIRNKAGIHCRPSSMIMAAAGAYSCHEITVEGPHGQTALNSILDLLAMGLQQGDTVRILVSGPKEEELCGKLAELFSTEFDFVR